MPQGSSTGQKPPFGTKGAHEGRRLWRKQAVVVEAPKGWRGEDSAKRFAAPEYRASEAQAGTKTPVRQGKPRVSLRTTRIDYAALWNGGTAQP